VFAAVQCRGIVSDPYECPHHGKIIYIKQRHRFIKIQKYELCAHEHIGEEIPADKHGQAVGGCHRSKDTEKHLNSSRSFLSALDCPPYHSKDHPPVKSQMQ